MKKRVIQCAMRETLVCRGCGANWKHDGLAIQTRCPFCGRTKDARIRKPSAHQVVRLKGLKKWSDSAENRAAKRAKDRLLLKKRLFFIVSGGPDAKCVRCGCDDWRLLEVNHKNGGGKREFEAGKYATQFYHNIVQGRRKADDLELLCRPCNAIHYLEMKFGKLPIRVVWEAK